MEFNKTENFTKTGVPMVDLRIGYVGRKPTLWKLSPEEEFTLLQHLSHPKSRIRWIAADQIGKREIKEGVDPLIIALKDSQWRVRLHAAKALGRIGDKKAILPLIECLTDENTYVVRRVITALILFDDESVIPHMFKLFQANIYMADIILPVICHFMSYNAVVSLLKAIYTNTKTWQSGTIFHEMKVITPLQIASLNAAIGEGKIKFLYSLGNYGDERAIDAIRDTCKSTNNRHIVTPACEAISQIECRKYEKYLP